MNWIVDNLELIGQLTLVHLATAVPPIVLSFVLSIPIGWAANRFAVSRGVVLSAAALLYAIPSLPFFLVMPIILGTGLRDSLNVVVVLTVYGVALMARSTADGLASVDADVRDSATARWILRPGPVLAGGTSVGRPGAAGRPARGGGEYDQPDHR